MQPFTQLRQRLRRQTVDAPAALRLVGDQPGVAQDLEVLGDGRAAELEPVAEFPGGKWLAGENLEQLPSHRVGQRREDVANAVVGAIESNHERQYMSENPTCQRRLAHTASFLDVHYDWERLTDTVHRCRLPFCDVTIGLVWGDNGALVIDTRDHSCGSSRDR